MGKRKKRKILKSYDDTCLTYGESFLKSNKEALKELKANMDPRAFRLAELLAEKQFEAHQEELRQSLKESKKR